MSQPVCIIRVLKRGMKIGKTLWETLYILDTILFVHISSILKYKLYAFKSVRRALTFCFSRKRFEAVPTIQSARNRPAKQLNAI